LSNLDFPVASGDAWHFPSEPLCPVCRSNPVFEPHEFVGISGGSATQTEGGEGFLSLFLHPEDSSSNAGAEVQIVHDTSTGQFDLYFCSTACVRSFLNSCVDELERRASNPAV